MTRSSYKGRVITLMSGLQDDATWVCEYTIVEFRPLSSFRESGFPIGSFITRDEAEAAAADIAHSVIDARDPVSVLSTDRFWGNHARADSVLKEPLLKYG